MFHDKKIVVDGKLDELQRRELERELAADPEGRRLLESMVWLRGVSREALSDAAPPPGLVEGIRSLFTQEFDRELSDFQARRLLDFFVRHLGAPIYNQAIQDARAAVQAKLDDLEGEFYEPESEP